MTRDPFFSLPVVQDSPVRVRITADAQRRIRRGSPWLFESGIEEHPDDAPAGALAALYGRGREFVGIGLFDPHSPIRVRLLRRYKPEVIDASWFARMAGEAASKRRAAGLGSGETTGFRLVNGESEGFPGLVVDVFGAVAVLKVYTASWLPWLRAVTPALFSVSGASSMVFRCARKSAPFFESCGVTDGCALFGDAPQDPVEFTEAGLRFRAHTRLGQKTGFYLDQRDNRARVRAMAAGTRVLDAFSFSGGFSLAAAAGGAREVVSLDSDPHAIAALESHFEINSAVPGVAAAAVRAVRCDAFSELPALAARGERFDLVVIDPPNLAPKERDRGAALAAFQGLSRAGAAALAPGGAIAIASCSSHVRESEFLDVVRSGLSSTGRRFVDVAFTGLPVDHPAAFPEARYLKCLFSRELAVT